MAEKGIVYICSTIIPGLIKIGMTGTDNFEERMRELETNGYQNCTGLKREFAIEVSDYKSKETMLHDLLDAHRVGKTELFAVNVDKVKKNLLAFDGKIIYPPDLTKTQIMEDADEGIQSSELPDGDYTFKPLRKSYEGKLKIENGILTLLAGSKLAKLTEKALDASPSWVSNRTSFGTNECILQEDFVCSSVSEAAYYVCGHSQNGWEAWKDSKGQSIKIYKK